MESEGGGGGEGRGERGGGEGGTVFESPYKELKCMCLMAGAGSKG